jgi:hypothetical protein
MGTHILYSLCSLILDVLDDNQVHNLLSELVHGLWLSA